MTVARQGWRSLESFAFGDSPEMADELLSLVLRGVKTATCWAASHGLKGSERGSRYVVLDGAGKPRAVIESVELTQHRFTDVDAAFAADEGEGDLSHAHWAVAHREFFLREGTYAPDMMLWCERFRVVEVIEAATL